MKKTSDEKLVYEVQERVEIGDLQPYAIQTLKSALNRVDKTGLPDKIAVDAAKFVAASSGEKDSNEYKNMLSSFRELVIATRKNKELDALKTIEEEEKERKQK